MKKGKRSSGHGRSVKHVVRPRLGKGALAFQLLLTQCPPFARPVVGQSPSRTSHRHRSFSVRCLGPAEYLVCVKLPRAEARGTRREAGSSGPKPSPAAQALRNRFAKALPLPRSRNRFRNYHRRFAKLDAFCLGLVWIARASFGSPVLLIVSGSQRGALMRVLAHL